MTRQERDKLKRQRSLAVKLITIIVALIALYTLVTVILTSQSSSINEWSFECDRQSCVVKGTISNESNSSLIVVLRATAIEEKWVGDAKVFKQLNSVTWEHSLAGRSLVHFTHKLDVYKKPDRVLLKVSDKNS